MINALNESIENFINERYEGIIKHDYSLFSNIEKITSGLFSTVRKATWRDNTIILKSINISTGTNEHKKKIFIKAFFNELLNLAIIDKHPNIVQFYGVTKDTENNQYNIILQFASDGNLREYLKMNFLKLKWSDKLRFALEIGEGLSFLHKNGIVHRDLHSKNILVHNQRMLIADFGISKHKDEETSVKAHVMSGYFEPQCLIDYNYKCDKRSDIYSFGVILWEISSGRPPFNGFDNDGAISVHVYNRKRETPIEDTPNDYVKLYQRCWDQDPDKRPEIDEVVRIIKSCQSPNRILSFGNNFIQEEFSTIIKAEHVEEIISWIYPLSHDNKFKLKLILRGSKDGFEKSTFYRQCKNENNTIIVLKVQSTGEILGGYNPLNWKEIEGKKYKKTDASFIFSLKNGQFSSTLSRIKNMDNAICCNKGLGPSFGYLDLYMSRNNGKTWGSFRANYEKEIKINESEKFEFKIQDYEVFKLLM